MSERREADIPLSSEQETEAKPTEGEAQPQSTSRRGPSGPGAGDDSEATGRERSVESTKAQGRERKT